MHPFDATGSLLVLREWTSQQMAETGFDKAGQQNGHSPLVILSTKRAGASIHCNDCPNPGRHCIV